MTWYAEMNIHCKYDSLVEVGSLKPHPKNRNKHPDDQIERLAKILKYQGVRAPIVVSRRSNKIVKGHGTLQAIKANQWDKAPVVYQDFEDDDQEWLFVQSDNAIASWAELDLKGINADIGELGPFDIDLIGIKDFVVEPAEKDLGDEEAVPEVRETNIKLGDLFILGDHRLLCGDSTDAAQVERLMNGEKADMVFTDPPYGVDYEDSKGRKIKNDKLTDQELQKFLEQAFIAAEQNCQENCAWFVWHADRYSCEFVHALKNAGLKLRQQIIWAKGEGKENSAQVSAPAIGGSHFRFLHEPCWYASKGKPFNLGDRKTTTLWTVPRPTTGTVHPTQKPIPLVLIALENSSAKNSKILDVFGGSGSTLIACEKTNRKCFMMELDPQYCQVIIDRWEQYTGKKAVKHG